MADKNIKKSVQLENSSYLSVEDSTRLCTGLTLNVYPFIIQFHIAKPLYGLLTVAAGDDIRSGNRYWQFTTVVDKATGQFPVCLIHRIGFERCRFLGDGCFGRRSCSRFRFFCSSLFAGSRFFTRLFRSTFTGFLNFFGYQAFNSRFQLVGFPTLLVLLILQPTLLLL